MIRLAVNRPFRLVLVFILTFCLVYAPVYPLNPARAETPASPEKAATPQPITKAHRAGEVLIRFKDDTPQEVRDQIVQTYAKNEKKLRGRGKESRLTIKDGLDLAKTIFDIKQLTPFVEFAEPNFLVTRTGDLKRVRARHAKQLPGTPNDPLFAAQWALNNKGQNGGVPDSDINAVGGWSQNTGSRDAVIAVIDTGLDINHPDLARNIWINKREKKGKKREDDDRDGYVDDVNGWNFIDDNANVSDDHGHGTAVAGIIAAEGNNRRGVAGVMWEASVMPLKALNSSGSGAISDVVEAMDYAVEHGASVINCSFGTESFSQSLLDAINRASRSGALVVASAGNDGRDLSQTPYYPASYATDNLITVAATTNGDMLADFSNYGGATQVAAPGIDVLTTYPGRKFVSLTGTSAAAPLVTGVAGLLKTIRGWASAQWGRKAIIDTARVVPTLDGKVASGGVASAGKAIAVFKRDNNGGGSNDYDSGSGNHGSDNNGSKSKGNLGKGQIGINLDYMLANKPKRPEPPVVFQELPGPGYIDPAAGSIASYYEAEGQPNNSTGIAGRKILESADTTASDDGAGGQSINLGSQNFNFSMPVLSLMGRAGLGVNLALSYNSKVWIKDPATNKMVFNADKGFPAPGWRIGFGVIQGRNNNGVMASYTHTPSGSLFQSYIYIEPDGTRHEMFYNPFNNPSQKYESFDSSYIEFTDSTIGSNRIMRLMNGTQITFGDYYNFQYLPTVIKDRNGNRININYRTLSNSERVIDYVTDTLGRIIEFYYENNQLTKVRQNRGGTYYDCVTISWQPITFTTNFDVATDPGAINGTTFWQPSVIQYPTGMNTRFFYTSYGQMYLIEKWVPTISGQGQERRVAYTRYNLPSYNGYSAPAGAVAGPANNSGLLTDAPAFTARHEWAENWNLDGSGAPQEVTYSYFFDPSGNFSTVTDPKDRVFSTSITTFLDSQAIYSRTYASTASYNNGSGTPLKTTLKGISWELLFSKNPRLINISVFEDTLSGSVRSTDIYYVTINSVSLPSDVEERHKPSLGLFTTYRRTHTDYKWDAAYFDRHIFGLKSSVKVYSGPGTTLLAQTDYNYDEGYLFLPASVDNVIQHDTANYGDGFIVGRGNLTSMTQYSVTGGVASSPRILGARTKYDTYGSVRAVFDPENRATGFETWDNFINKPGGVGETHAMTTSVSAPADLIGGVMLNQKSGTKFDYYTGLPVQTYHINASSGQPENITNYTYTTGDRILSVTRPDGGYTNFEYWDNLLSQATYALIDIGKQQFSFIALDGAGRMRWQGRDHPNGTPGWFSIQRQFYDSVGRTTDVSNVTAADGELAPLDGENWYYTTTEYDALDRPLKVYRQDHTGGFNSFTQFDYNGCGCAGVSTVTITDERGKKRKQVRDFLGRLAEAHDLTASGATYSKAVYSYTALDQLWKVEHYDGGAKRQDRTFVYDGYGRQQSVNTPEVGASGGDGIDYTYTYTPDDLLYTVTDARGITNTFSYNNRRLLTQVNYGDADTPDVFYDYGEYGERKWMEERNNAGTVLGRTTYDYWADMKLKSETRQFEIAGNPLPQGAGGIMQTGTYKLEYTWNTSGGLNRMTATVNGWVKNVNFGWNSAGGSSGVGTNIIGTNPDTTTNVVNGLQYRGFGGLRQGSYGNGRKLTVGYDLKRQQMTSLFLRKNDESDPLINVSYDYYNGGGNNGRLQRLTDSYDPGYSVTYEYDDFQRLKKATAGNFTREYSYDAWGNLTNLFNVTGPTETGNYTITYATNSSGAPANNRVLNVNGGITHSYDDAGNLAFDGWSYSHDAANRLKSVNGGNVTYGYDGDGRRVKNQVSPYAPMYYLWSSVLGQVAAEINGCDGSVFRAYVYSAGGQLLAQQSYDGQFYWVHKDHLGSGVRLTDVNGAMIYRSVLDPHGQVLLEWAQDSETYKSSKKFTGYEREWATNLDFAQARYYHHNRGRFLQPDPMGLEAADVTAPQTLNRYSYVANDPVNNVDPTGLHTMPFAPVSVCLVSVVEDPEGGIAGARIICGTAWSGPVSPFDVNVALPDCDCPGVTVNIWDEDEGNVGHASLELSDGTYISWWPEQTPTVLQTMFDINIKGATQTFTEDKLMEGGREPSHRIKIAGLDEGAIKGYWDKFRQNNQYWSALSKSCTQVVTNALLAGVKDAGLQRMLRRISYDTPYMWPAQAKNFAKNVKRVAERCLCNEIPFLR